MENIDSADDSVVDLARPRVGVEMIVLVRFAYVCYIVAKPWPCV